MRGEKKKIPFPCKNLSRTMSALLLCLKIVYFPGLEKSFVEDTCRERKDETDVKKVIFKI